MIAMDTLLRAVGRERDQGQVAWQDEFLADAPANAVEDERAVVCGRVRAREPGQEQAGSRGRDLRREPFDACLTFGAGGPEQVDKYKALLMKTALSHVPLLLDAGKEAFLADLGSVHFTGPRAG
jgi:hypothetical protein